DDKLVELTDDWQAAAATLPDGRWTDLDEIARGPLVGLRDGLWSLREAVARSPEGESANDPEKAAERVNLANHLQELHDAIVRILTVFDESDPAAQRDVVWLERDDRRGDVLTVAPLSVAGLLHEKLFGEQTVVLTSAT